MDIYVLNTNFEVTAVIDSFESFIWTDRYIGYGDFEIYVPCTSHYLNVFVHGYYLNIGYSRHTMIIETVQLATSAETGNHLIISGRSLESIIDRRIIWPTKIIAGKMEEIIKSMINDYFINPIAVSKSNLQKLRKISNLVYLDSGNSKFNDYVVEQKDDSERTGDNVYNILVELLEEFEVGYRIYLTSEGKFEFQLYEGVDRSFDQDENIWIIFSPEYENIVSTDYIEDFIPYKNYVVVGSKDSGVIKYFGDVETVGLEHREIFADSSNASEGTELEAIAYQTLRENFKDIRFTGEVEAQRQFIYGRDFNVGDVVQIENEYGLRTSARVTEFVINYDDSGLQMYPTFEGTEDADYVDDNGG